MGKRRANGEGSIRQRPDGRWEGRYTVGVDYTTGKAINKSVFAKSQSEVRDKLRTAIAENRGPAINHKGTYTVAEWLRLWFDVYAKPNVRPSTKSNYTNLIENHIIPAIGRIKLKQLSAIQIQKLYNDTRDHGRVKRFEKTTDFSLSGRFVRAMHMVLHSCLEQAVKERLISYNPCDNCRIPKKEHKEMQIIPPEQIGAYLKQAGESGVLPMFYLELTSGLRRGELLALLWADLDVKQRTISVSKQVGRQNGELVVSTPKTPNSIRTVVIPQQAVELLTQEHEKHPDSPYLFMSPRTGGMWSPDAVGRIHKNLLKRAGIDQSVRFHDLRHTFATLALQNGVDVKTVSSMLGHYSAGFTLDTYTHVTNKMQQDAADKMGGFMDAAIPEKSECKIIPFERVV